MTMWTARTLVPGKAEGPVVALEAPLSFWGGFDAALGRIADRRHPDLGRSCTGSILVMTARGSSSGSSVLAEALRLRTGPAAIVLTEADPILAVGALVAHDLYGIVCPVVVAREGCLDAIRAAGRLLVEAEDGIGATICLRGEAPL
jgi:uncharacterized protein